VDTEVTRSFMRGLLSPALGVAMIAAAAPHAQWLAACTAGLALAAVPVGVRFARAATLAVLLTALTLAVSTPPSMLVLVSGLCATGYLVTRHANGPNAAVPTLATVVSAVGFGLTAAVVAVIPVDVVWLPLLAPFALLGAYAMATNAYLRARSES
jgi:hypothetical protein